jgi:transcriptional regulator with XRE-family HTH domain
MTASIGPTVRRRRLGTELRRLREAHSIKLEEVAEKLGLAASTLSRIETGKAPTRTAYLSAMLDLYGVHDPGGRQILVDMAREGHRKGWWAAWEDVLPTGFDVYVGLEAEAASLRAYESLVVHGLLQTEAYARVVMTTVRRRQTQDQIERLVALRMQRQEVILRADPIELWLILDEAVIRRTMGSPELMRGQLNHLADASLWPNVTLQVLPFSSGPHPCLNGPFAIIETRTSSTPRASRARPTSSVSGTFAPGPRPLTCCARLLCRRPTRQTSSANSPGKLFDQRKEIPDVAGS